METYHDKLKTKLAVSLATPEMRALDIGCATGRVTVPLAAVCRSVIGLDYDGERVEAVLSRLAEFPNAGAVRGQAEALPFAEATFDLIVFVSTVVSVSDPVKALLEARRVLAKDGRALIELHGIRNANARFWKAYYAERSAFYNAFSLRDAERLLASCGFTIEQRICNSLTRAHLYIRPLDRIPILRRIFHSGHEPDLDYIISNLPGLAPFASTWFFVVRGS